MTDKPKLELIWIGKESRPRLEPRILVEDKALSYRAEASVPAQGDLLVESNSPEFQDNLLIQGDNLLGLKALESMYAGKVKCVFIDPPYNTGSAFTHYDDGVEHSLWLTLIRDRLEIIRELLADDGSLWITIDDTEAHYLKVLCDEIFGRRNFVANVVWQKRTAPDNRLRIGDAHDNILVYCKNISVGKSAFNQLPISETRAKDFRNPDSDPRGAWTSDNLTGMTGHATASQFYVVKTPSGEQFAPPPGRCWAL
ncbi:site-specific DNA-methyltransferase, partial [Pseudomonas congelans]|uniref:site-specific DNA-methyltransferase n=1 Tax=Pseudomonas congelans TaxID=200452 RepID=UPI001F208C1D